MDEQELKKVRGDFVAEEPEAEEPVVEEPVAEEPVAEEPVAEEPEAEDEGQPGDPPPDEAPITIPKARFDEAQRKARERQKELERRIEEMEAQQTQKQTHTDLDALNKEIEDLENQFVKFLMDGETEKAQQVRRQQQQKQNDLFDRRLSQYSRQASTAAIEQMRYDAQLAQYEARYPVINPDSDAFDEAVASEVAEMMSAFQAGKGLTMAAALNKAVRYVLRDDTPAAHDDPQVVRQKRAQQSRKRVASAAQASPPSLSDRGRDSDKVGHGDGLPDVTKMTPEQFDKLTEAQRRKLRGDDLSDEVAA